MHSGWPHIESPFHSGEQQVQDRLGVRTRIENFARRVVRDHLPDQHRDFYEKLPFVLVGTVDGEGWPWASLVVGRPGFIQTPDARTLSIAGKPLHGDPLHETLRDGADVGVLGIELPTRRRNRLTGRIRDVTADGFAIAIAQTFGNCPQYIQSREVELNLDGDTIERKRRVVSQDHLDERARTLIERADTLFIATAYRGETDSPTFGADVSHRGGKPGFVRIEDDRTFLFPDFSGNNHFNTVGNLVLNPRAGFLFADFDAGDVLYLTGTADVIWEGDGVRAFAGAERLIRFRTEKAIWVEASLPLRFRFDAFSPILDKTGSWEQSAEIIAASKERNAYVPHEVFRTERESDVITSFYLRRADGKPVAAHEPGQYLPVRINLPGHTTPALRTYTISDIANGDHYRLSIKREQPGALVSNYMHKNTGERYQLEAMAPRGKFILDRSSDRPAVLLSAGVGITPMIAMANFIAAEGRRTRRFRKTYFIHGARNGNVQAFAEHVRSLATLNEAMNVHVRYSQPTADDQVGVTHDSEGTIDVELLKRLLPFDDYDFYMCGPQAFMQSLYDGLTALGVQDERIHYESFGPATVLKQSRGPLRQSGSYETSSNPITVRFSGSNIEAGWTAENGTLLELAESVGLRPAFACRSGTCGTCATRLKCGAVDYLEEPSAPINDGEVLICCATPKAVSGNATCGETKGVVLDL